MIHFIKKIIVICSVIVLTVFLLELTFNSVYKFSNPRSKAQYIMRLKNVNYDAIFIGSSRVENHIKTNLFKAKGLKILNLGISGANLNENLLMLKLLISNNVSAKNIFFQMDHNFEYQTPSKGITAMFLPFIHDSIVSAHYNNILKDYWMYKNIPFYRYAVNDAKIGAREFAMNIINKPPKISLKNGYVPLFNSMSKGSYVLPAEVRAYNIIFIEIERLKQEHQINIIYFTTPFCQNTKNLDYLVRLKEKHIPKLKDYSRLIKLDSLFNSCGHLNDKGAEVLTNKIISDFYGKG